MQTNSNTNDKPERNNFERMPYKKAKILTKTEFEFFVILTLEAHKRRLLVCPKVRLEDIAHVTEYKNRNKYRGYIKSRHVDFALIDTQGNTIAAIELDDPSHNTREAAYIDRFKNELFKTIEIPLIRIKTGIDYKSQIIVAFDQMPYRYKVIK